MGDKLWIKDEQGRGENHAVRRVRNYSLKRSFQILIILASSSYPLLPQHLLSSALFPISVTSCAKKDEQHQKISQDSIALAINYDSIQIICLTFLVSTQQMFLLYDEKTCSHDGEKPSFFQFSHCKLKVNQGLPGLSSLPKLRGCWLRVRGSERWTQVVFWVQFERYYTVSSMYNTSQKPGNVLETEVVGMFLWVHLCVG